MHRDEEPSGAAARARQYAVGFAVLEFPAERGPAPLALRRDGRGWRQLHVWYPAQPSGGRTRALLTPLESRALAEVTLTLGATAEPFASLERVTTDTRERAPLAEGRFPALLYNHGQALWPTHNFRLCEALASRGYVVCALAHPGESAAVTWLDGEVTPADVARLQSTIMSGDALRSLATYLASDDEAHRRALLPELASYFADTLMATTRRWARESVDTFDWLCSDDAPAVARPIFAQVDAAQRGYLGMSLGGSVASECCFLDAHARVGINLDGIAWAFDRIDCSVPVPFMQLYADPAPSRAQLLAHADPAHTAQTTWSARPNDFHFEAAARRGMRTDVVRATILGAAHDTFTDYASIAAAGEERERHAVIVRLVATFLDEHLAARGDASVAAVLDGTPLAVRQVLVPPGHE